MYKNNNKAIGITINNNPNNYDYSSLTLRSQKTLIQAIIIFTNNLIFDDYQNTPLIPVYGEKSLVAPANAHDLLFCDVPNWDAPSMWEEDESLRLV